MKAQEIIDMVCKPIEDDSHVWIFIHNSKGLTRINVGFDAWQLMGMAANATHEICALLAGDTTVVPRTIELAVCPRIES